MSPSKGTMPRSLRIPEDVWLPAVEKARREGTTVTAKVVAFLREDNQKTDQPERTEQS